MKAQDDLTTNARLIKAGLYDDFLLAEKAKDHMRMIELLRLAGMSKDQSEGIVKAISRNWTSPSSDKGRGHG